MFDCRVSWPPCLNAVHPMKLFKNLLYHLADSSASVVVVIGALWPVVQSTNCKGWNFLGVHLLRHTINQRGNRCSILLLSGTTLSTYVLDLAPAGVSICSIFRCVPSFPSLTHLLFKSLVHEIWTVLISLTPVCPLFSQELDVQMVLQWRFDIFK